jgi:hypothetical protein
LICTAAAKQGTFSTIGPTPRGAARRYQISYMTKIKFSSTKKSSGVLNGWVKINDPSVIRMSGTA